jgi:hypothetical protein
MFSKLSNVCRKGVPMTHETVTRYVVGSTKSAVEVIGAQPTMRCVRGPAELCRDRNTATMSRAAEKQPAPMQASYRPKIPKLILAFLVIKYTTTN